MNSGASLQLHEHQPLNCDQASLEASGCLPVRRCLCFWLPVVAKIGVLCGSMQKGSLFWGGDKREMFGFSFNVVFSLLRWDFLLLVTCLPWYLFGAGTCREFYNCSVVMEDHYDDSFQHIQFGDGDGKVREAMKVFVGSLMYKTTLQASAFSLLCNFA